MKIQQFVNQVKTEIMKVEWPTFPEFIGAVIVVFIVVIASAIFLGSADRTISWLIKKIFLMYGS